jgi:hypothetical protein
MGADYVGWRACALQQELGEHGFLGKIKLRVYKRVVEERVPEDQRATIKLNLQVTGREPRETTYPEICAELDTFEAGIPECASCPLGNGNPVSCYRYVTYPIDAGSETLLFRSFCRELVKPDSTAYQIWQDIVRHIDRDSNWHQDRGEEGMLAELAQPLTFSWQDDEGRHEVDSAQLLEALFIGLDQPPVLVAYAVLFKTIVEDVFGRISVGADGQLELRVEVSELGDVTEELITQELDALKHVGTARSLLEISDLAPMLLQAAVHAVDDGWSVVVDS